MTIRCHVIQSKVLSSNYYLEHRVFVSAENFKKPSNGNFNLPAEQFVFGVISRLITSFHSVSITFLRHEQHTGDGSFCPQLY